MARFYANENFPLPVVEELRRLGHDIVTIQQTGKSGEGTPDEEVLTYAIQQQRAILTLNRKDFRRLHHQQPQHDGIVICTVDGDFARQATRIHDAVQSLATLRGLLIRVNRPDR